MAAGVALDLHQLVTVASMPAPPALGDVTGLQPGQSRVCPEAGELKKAWLSEAPMLAGRWEMAFDTRQGNTVYAETRRGGPKRFASLEAAIHYADDLGFKNIEINW